MKIADLKKRPNIEQGSPLATQYDLLKKMMQETQQEELSSPIIAYINKEITSLNTFSGSEQELLTHLEKVHSEIQKILAKELDLVPKNRYRSLILVLGMGVLAGITSSVSGFDLGIGITLGMIVGLTIGICLDNKATRKTDE